MKIMKIVPGFYDAKEAGKVARAQKKTAKAKGLTDVSVATEDAYSFYMRNDWFKKQLRNKNRPLPGQKVVIMSYHRQENCDLISVVAEIKEMVLPEVVVKNIGHGGMLPGKSRNKNAPAFSPAVLIPRARRLVCAAKKSMVLGIQPTAGLRAAA